MKFGEISYDLREPNNVFIWQYSRAANLTRLLQNEIEFYGNNVGSFFTDWEKDVFNLHTANSFGLSVWAKILGVSRPNISPQNYIIDKNNTLRLYNPNSNNWHAIYLNSPMPAWAIERNPIVEEVPLIPIDDNTFRRCLLAKINLLYSNGSVTDISQYLTRIFPNKGAYVEDGYDMSLKIKFTETPTDSDLTIITSPDFSPKVAGVFINTGVEIISKDTFGFKENELATWMDRAESDSSKVEKGYGNFYNVFI